MWITNITFHMFCEEILIQEYIDRRKPLQISPPYTRLTLINMIPSQFWKYLIPNAKLHIKKNLKKT